MFYQCDVTRPHACCRPWLSPHGSGSGRPRCPSFHDISYGPWHTSVESMNDRWTKTKTRQNNQKMTLLSWGKLGSIFQREACPQKACRQVVTPLLQHSLRLSKLRQARDSRSRRAQLRLFGLKNKKLLPSLVSCNSH